MNKHKKKRKKNDMRDASHKAKGFKCIKGWREKKSWQQQ